MTTANFPELSDVSPDPLNIKLVDAARTIESGLPVHAILEPRPFTRYGLLVVPGWASTAIVPNVIQPRDWLWILQHVTGSPAALVRRDVVAYHVRDMCPGPANREAREVLTWWLTHLWAAIDDVRAAALPPALRGRRSLSCNSTRQAMGRSGGDTNGEIPAAGLAPTAAESGVTATS